MLNPKKRDSPPVGGGCNLSQPKLGSRLVFSINLINACSVVGKWGELADRVADVDVVALTETWLTDSTETLLDRLPDRTCYSQRRTDGRVGGGVALCIANTLVHREGTKLHTPAIQAVQCYIQSPSMPTSVLAVYRSPSATAEEDASLLRYIQEAGGERVRTLVVGDFNAPEVHWEQGTAPPRSFGATLVDCLDTLGLIQHVKDPTRFRQGQRSSLLDLVISSHVSDVTDLQITAPLGKSDHAVVEFTFNAIGRLRGYRTM